MKTIGAFEAKTHLSQLLDRVENGEEITITRHGLPVAVLAPAKPANDRNSTKALIKEIQQLRAGLRLENISVKQLAHEGHKY
jgi:prevent-host-death family protein